MKFGNSIIFIWLWLVPLLAAFFWLARRQRRRALERFAAPHLWAVIAPSWNSQLGVWRAALLTAIVLLLLISMAYPRWGFHWQEVRRRGIDIFVALDVSKSMLAQDVRPNRLEQAKLAVRDLLKEAVGDRVGLIAFAGSAFANCPLTLDHAAVQLTLDDLTTESIPVGGTDIGGAIREAIRGFSKGADRNRALILITDGEATTGDPMSAAKSAANINVKIFTIGIGTTAGELIPIAAEGGTREFLKDREGKTVLSRLDEATLQQLALTTGGYYVHATAGNFGLDTIYKNGIAGMEAKDYETQLVRQYEERFQWPLGLALLLLVAEALLRERRKEAPQVGRSSEVAAIVIGFFLFNSLLFAADISESPPKLYNGGNAAYRLKQFEEAAKSYQQSLVSKDAALQERAFYNLGNAFYRQGDPLEANEKEKAMELFKQSVSCYDSALALDPKDADAAFNKQIVEVRLKKLEQQQKQQQQQQQKQDQQKQQQKQQQQQQGQQQQEQQKQDQQQQQQAPQQQQQQPQPQQQQQREQPGEPREMSEQEAKQLLDALRDEEKHWKELAPLRKLGEREPEKNW